MRVISQDEFESALELRRCWLKEIGSKYGLSEEPDVFCNKDFTGLDFSNVSLKGIRFEGSNLTHVNFSNSDLTGCDFSRAKIRGTQFEGANLTDVKGIEFLTY